MTNELYVFFFHTIHELHMNHELRITNREYTHSIAAPLATVLFADKYMWVYAGAGMSHTLNPICLL